MPVIDASVGDRRVALTRAGAFGTAVVVEAQPHPKASISYATPRCSPAPARRMPVMVTGKGERTMRLTARYADAWTTAWYGRPDDPLRAQLDVMARILDDEGRDPATLRRLVGVEVVDPEQESAHPHELTMERRDLAAALDGYRRADLRVATGECALDQPPCRRAGTGRLNARR